VINAAQLSQLNAQQLRETVLGIMDTEGASWRLFEAAILSGVGRLRGLIRDANVVVLGFLFAKGNVDSS
jgi:hypothetical protein